MAGARRSLISGLSDSRGSRAGSALAEHWARRKWSRRSKQLFKLSTASFVKMAASGRVVCEGGGRWGCKLRRGRRKFAGGIWRATEVDLWRERGRSRSRTKASGPRGALSSPKPVLWWTLLLLAATCSLQAEGKQHKGSSSEQHSSHHEQHSARKLDQQVTARGEHSAPGE